MALTDSLISYWKLDEASGNALDAHGSNNLTDNNTVGSATGKIGNARDFERGNSEYFSKASNSDLQTGDIDFTITAWVQLESKPAGSAMQIVTKFSDASNEYAVIYHEATDRFMFFSGTGFSSVTASNFGSPSTGVWYFILASFTASSNTISIRVNNGAPNTATITPVAAGSANFKIGNRDDATEYWDGLIDEVGLWKRLLTSNEQASLYNAGRGLAYPFTEETNAPLTIGLLTCYELDESSGNAVDAFAGNNATLTGSSASATGKIAGARSLTGSTNRFESSIVPSGYPISMSCWVKTSNTSASLRDPFFLGHSSVNDHYFGLQLATNHKPVWSYSMVVGGVSAWYITGPTAINDGNWHHLVGITRSANDHQLYVDGASAGTDTTNIGAFTSLDRQTLGALNYGGTMIQYYIGDLDQCVVWFADITSLISTLYNSGNGLPYSSWSGGHPSVARSRFIPHMHGNNRFTRVG